MRDLQTVIEDLAARLDRAVAVDDPSIRLLAHTAHHEKVDDHRIQSIMTLHTSRMIADYVFGLGIRTASEPVRIPRRDDVNLLSRICVPIRCQNLLLGYLWLIDDDESLTQEGLDASVEAANAAGQILYQHRLLSDLRRSRERDLVLNLVSDNADVVSASRQSDIEFFGLAERLDHRVVAVDAPFAEHDLNTEAGHLALEAALQQGTTRLQRVRVLSGTTRGGRGYLLVAFRPREDPLPQLRDLGTRMHAELLSRLPGRPDVVIGIGPAVSDVRSVQLSAARAEAAIRIARAIRGFAPVAVWEDLGIYRVLERLPVGDFFDAAIPAGLKTLLAVESDSWLIDTLDTYLDTGGNAQESAQRLHIHRATLYYRVSRIEELSGMSLSDGSDRLALHLGVKLARLHGLVDATSPAEVGDPSPSPVVSDSSA